MGGGAGDGGAVARRSATLVPRHRRRPLPRLQCPPPLHRPSQGQGPTQVQPPKPLARARRRLQRGTVHARVGRRLDARHRGRAAQQHRFHQGGGRGAGGRRVAGPGWVPTLQKGGVGWFGAWEGPRGTTRASPTRPRPCPHPRPPRAPLSTLPLAPTASVKYWRAMRAPPATRGVAMDVPAGRGAGRVGGARGWAAARLPRPTLSAPPHTSAPSSHPCPPPGRNCWSPGRRQSTGR